MMIGISRLNSVFLFKGWAKKRNKFKVLGNIEESVQHKFHEDISEVSFFVGDTLVDRC